MFVNNLQVHATKNYLHDMKSEKYCTLFRNYNVRFIAIFWLMAISSVLDLANRRTVALLYKKTKAMALPLYLVRQKNRVIGFTVIFIMFQSNKDKYDKIERPIYTFELQNCILHSSTPIARGQLATSTCLNYVNERDV